MPTLVVTVTERCNADCAYCCVVGRRDALPTLPLGLLGTLFVRVDEYLRAHPGRFLEILWHGGEPLLAGRRFWQAAVSLQRKHCARTQARIVHGLQTNLTLLTARYLQVLLELPVQSIGTSFDPVPGMRGLGRRVDSRVYNERFLAAMPLLEGTVPWGVIHVVTGASLRSPLDVFVSLVNLFPTHPLNLNPLLAHDRQRPDAALAPGQYLAFLGAVFEYWWPRRERFANVQPFRGLVDRLIDQEPSPDAMAFGVCDLAADTVGLRPDGRLAPCGSEPALQSISYGHIAERPLAEVFHEEQPMLEASHRQKSRAACHDCRWLALCHGGARQDAEPGRRVLISRSRWCEARTRFLEDCFLPITGVPYEPEMQHAG